MRNIFAVAAIFLTACASSGPSTPRQKTRIPEPDFAIRQIVGPPELNYEEGNIEVKFRLDIGNHADVPIKLSRMEIVTVNPEGGAYTLDASHRAYYFHLTIEPHKAGSVEFWAKAIGYGRSARENEPITVRGTLYFETPGGYYDQVFVKEIGQYAGQND